MKLPKETADLPVELDGDPFILRAAIHENHAENERADKLFMELYSVARVDGTELAARFGELAERKDYAGHSAAGSPKKIVHMRWPMMTIDMLARMEKAKKGFSLKGAPVGPVLIDTSPHLVVAVELKKNPQGTRADQLRVRLRSQAVVVERIMLIPIRLLKILLKEAEPIA